MLLAPPPIVVHVDAVPRRLLGRACLFRILAPVRKGGQANVCLTTLHGLPGPGSTIRRAGTAVFSRRDALAHVRLASRLRFRRVR